MEFNFVVNKDSLRLLSRKKAVAGNCNSYKCCFSLSEDYAGLSVFAVFESGDVCYTVEVLEGVCLLPFEILNEAAAFTVGIFATNGSSDDYTRISTNTIMINVESGAYSVCCIPGTPEIWENYLFQIKESLKQAEEILGGLEKKAEDALSGQIENIVNDVIEALPKGDEVSY